MAVLRVDTIAGLGETFGPSLEGNLEFNSQNYVILPKGTSNQQGVLRTTEDVIGVGGTYYDNLVLAMPFNEATGLRDVSSRNRNPGTYGNVAISTAQSKYYGSSAYFDGSGDYLGINSNNDFVFGSSTDFTIESWIYPTSYPTRSTIISSYPSGTSGNWIFLLLDDKLALYVYPNATFNFTWTSSSSVPLNQWSYVTLTRIGTTWRIFINGILENTATQTQSMGNLNQVTIGHYQSNANSYFDGYIQDLRIYKGIAKYTTDFTPPDRIAETGVGFKTGQLRYNTDSNKPELYDGNQWTELQISSPNLDGGARGLLGGGYVSPNTGNNTIDYINISSTGNALNFGDLLSGSSTYYNASFSSSTRGVWAAGTLGPALVNIVSYVTISSTGDAQDFGDTSTSNHSHAGCSNSTRGLVGGGYPSPANVDINTIEYVTVASTGNFVDFGDLTQIRRALSSTSNSTRGLWGGGIYTTPAPTAVNSNIIDYVTIASLGSAQDFGDLSVSRVNVSACANSTRGLFAGGNNPGVLNTIDYVTIASLGNAVNFGTSSTSALFQTAALSSSIRGVFGGRTSPAVLNTIDYVTILTQGNAVDFGDLTVARGTMSACSNAHGGL